MRVSVGPLRRARLGPWELRLVRVARRAGRVEDPQFEVALWRRFHPPVDGPELEVRERAVVALRWYGWPRVSWEEEPGDQIVAAARARGRRESSLARDALRWGSSRGAVLRLTMPLAADGAAVFVREEDIEHVAPGDVLVAVPPPDRDWGPTDVMRVLRTPLYDPRTSGWYVPVQRQWGGSPGGVPVELGVGTELLVAGRASGG